MSLNDPNYDESISFSKCYNRFSIIFIIIIIYNNNKKLHNINIFNKPI